MISNELEGILKNAKAEFSLLAKNLKTKDIISINIEKKMPSASIIKLFIMGSVLELVADKKLHLDTHIAVEKSKNVDYSIVSMLDSVRSYSIYDLVKLMITVSDNTACNMLIDFLGIKNINNFIKEKGFKDTILNRKMMDLKAKREGKENYTTAEDTCNFLLRLYKGELIDKEMDKLMVDILKLQMDNSMMRMKLPDNLYIAHKTGDLTNVKNDAGIVYSKKAGDYVFSMFTKNAISDEYARELVAEVSRKIYDLFGGCFYEDKRHTN